MSCCNQQNNLVSTINFCVTIPQAVWAVATLLETSLWHTRDFLLQYRKRYELLQLCDDVNAPIDFSYNTASGMSCCNGIKGRMQGYRPITLLQYRKRYELLQQLVEHCTNLRSVVGYNTASGMSCCNNGGFELVSHPMTLVTIPQAVWAVATELLDSHELVLSVTIPQAVWAVATRQNFSSEKATLKLQYRKRYELLQRVCKCYRKKQRKQPCYNTASGMSCCNLIVVFRQY